MITLLFLSILFFNTNTSTVVEAPSISISSFEERVIQDEICEEDMPCWDCETMGNKICGNVEVPEVVEVTSEPTIVEEYIEVPETSEVVIEPTEEVVVPSPVEVPTIEAPSLEDEAKTFGDTPYIPTDEFCTVTYEGTSPHDRTDGDALWSVQSEIDPTVWHTYRIVETPVAAK